MLADILRNTARVPVFPPHLPKSMSAMMREYEKFELVGWETSKMTGWPASVKQAYSRRKYINNLVKGRAMVLHHGTFEQRLVRAAETLDIERKSLGLSVFRYIDYLKKNDPTVKTRKRKILSA